MPQPVVHNRPHSLSQSASPPTPLQGERGVRCLVNYKVKPHSPTAIGLTPYPSPRGEGSEMPCEFKLFTS